MRFLGELAKRERGTVKIWKVIVTMPQLHVEIKRVLLVPANICLDDLHFVLQAAMGWDNEHLYDFRAGRSRRSTINWCPKKWDSWGGATGYCEDTTLEMAVNLASSQTGSGVLKYVYDFGDHWEHKLVIRKLKRFDPKLAYPVLLDVVGTCPPEDCGGRFGFYRLLNALEGDRSDSDERLEYYADFDVDAPDIEALRRDVRRLAAHLTD